MVKSKGGRPEIYSEKLGQEICMRLMQGESLRKICKDDAMPNIDTVCTWLLQEDKALFSEQYRRARAVQAEIMADEILEIADDSTNDKFFNPVTERMEEDREVTQTKKLRVEARLKLMQLQAPKRFGTKPEPNTDPEKGVTNVQVNYVFPDGWKPPKLSE